MEENILNSGSFSLRKIPVNQKDSLTNQNNCIKDKIKILELSNYIDEWENTLLFSEKGFFSLKGKEAENKTKEYSSELEDFINTQIAQMHFESNEAKQIAYNIKKDKRAAIEKQMQLYENEQMQQWETSVYENALKSAIKRAVLYKNNDSIISTSFKNGLTVLSLMEEKEHWEKKTYNSRKKMFESEFYYSLIKEFIKDKDVHAALYFEKYKEKLSDKQYEELEESIKYLKINVTAYNYA
ncbi:MAG: hypothetical protein LUG16_01095, partial [Candidatus Gastranaerophilales bacterium]|nr:hypothetical protein [Candidatus Gastranaerophilales bacterium]